MKLTKIIHTELSDEEVAELKKYRKEIGVKQSELAERAGIDVTWLSKIENGKAPLCSQDLWEKLFNILANLEGQV